MEFPQLKQSESWTLLQDPHVCTYPTPHQKKKKKRKEKKRKDPIHKEFREIILFYFILS